MNHIYSLEKLNDEKEKINFEKVYTEMLTEQIKVIERFRNNMNKSSKLSLLNQSNQTYQNRWIWICPELGTAQPQLVLLLLPLLLVRGGNKINFLSIILCTIRELILYRIHPCNNSQYLSNCIQYEGKFILQSD